MRRRSAKLHCATEIANLQQALTREKARSEDAARQMAKMADEMRAAQERQGATASTEIANLQQALTREKARSEDATRQMAKLADEMRALQDAKVTPRIVWNAARRRAPPWKSRTRRLPFWQPAQSRFPQRSNAQTRAAVPARRRPVRSSSTPPTR